MTTIYIRQVPDKPWLVTLNFPYRKQIVEWVKAVPGAQWDNNRKLWTFPVEMVDTLREEAQNLRACIAGQTPTTTREIEWKPFDGWEILHPYQQEAVKRAVKEPGWLFNDEPGLGKSIQAIATLRARQIKRALIVCPAQARYVWHHPKRPGFGQLDKWWPEHPEVSVVEPGKPIKPAPVTVVSYEMLTRLMGEADEQGWEAIVFDEIHYCQNPRTKRSMACADVVSKNPAAIRLGLTGTPITNGPDTLCNPLNLLFPKRYGGVFKFASRYCNATHNGYGWEFGGVNPKHEGELRRRVGLVSSRAIQGMVQDLLPPLRVGCLFVDPRDRVSSAVQWVEDARHSGFNKLCLLVHHREMAAAVAKQLDGSVLITGEMTHAERVEAIERARQAEEAIVVATLHSVNVAIDMAFFPMVCLVEAYARPADIIQVLGRFPRLGGQVSSVNVSLLVSEQGNDPAEVVAKKIEDINKVIKAGRSEEKMASVVADMRNAGMTEDDINDLLLAAAQSYTPEEI